MAFAHDIQALRPINEPLGSALVKLDEAVARKVGKSVIQNIADLGGWKAPEADSERYRMLEAALASRGMPWKLGGGEGTHDAWSLLRDCSAYATERDAMEVIRDGALVSEASARMAFTQWGLSEIRVRHAEPGDIVLFDLDGGVVPAILSAPGGEMSWALVPAKTRPEAKIITASHARPVRECWAGPYWTDKLFTAFSFEAPSPSRTALKAAA